MADIISLQKFNSYLSHFEHMLEFPPEKKHIGYPGIVQFGCHIPNLNDDIKKGIHQMCGNDVEFDPVCYDWIIFYVNIVRGNVGEIMNGGLNLFDNEDIMAIPYIFQRYAWSIIHLYDFMPYDMNDHIIRDMGQDGYDFGYLCYCTSQYDPDPYYTLLKHCLGNCVEIKKEDDANMEIIVWFDHPCDFFCTFEY